MNDIQLSEHFKLSEFVNYSTAKRLGIDDTHTGEIISNLKVLCERVLESLRAQDS